MKRLIAVTMVMTFFACKKNNINNNYPTGIFVEETLRLDTIDFTVNERIDAPSPIFALKAKPFTEPGGPSSTNVFFNSSTYDFKIKNDSIDLRAHTSSFNGFYTHKFEWTKGNSYFTIGKFYYRSVLGNTLRFVKL